MTALYSLEQVAIMTGGELFSQHPQTGVERLLIDSRRQVAVDGTLFFAIAGERHDGHKYIGDLYDKGFRNFVISNRAVVGKFPEASFIVVPNTLYALQELAGKHRQQLNLPIVAITGSNGKTTVKEWLFQLLYGPFNLVRSPKSYNSQVGVPLSVWEVHPEHEVAVLEAGISQVGEMKKLEAILQPEIGLFTNIGEAHSENFDTLEQKTREKLHLFRRCNKLIYCRDHELIHTCIENDPALKDVEKIIWSFHHEAFLQVRETVVSDATTEVEVQVGENLWRYQLPFTDSASLENSLHCFTVALVLGADPQELVGEFFKLSPVAMRLEIKAGVNGCTLINDTYNSDPESLSVALDLLERQSQHEKKTLILSDLHQSGREEEALYREISNRLSKKSVNRIIGIGQAIQQYAENFQAPEKQFFPDTESFMRQLSFSQFSDEAILIKGARSFGFERISSKLQQKNHETVLEINLQSMVENLNYYRRQMGANTRIMAMVKAFSYGSGSYEIASLLEYHRVDYLAVAYADEGVELRRAGIQLPIMVMNPESQSHEALLEHRLEPEIYSLRTLKEFVSAARKFPDNETVYIHLKLETGMHRLGFETKDLQEALSFLNAQSQVKVRTAFSHLAAADEAHHDEFTRGQIQRFDSMSKTVQSALDYPIWRHIVNSAGALRFPEARFDMVRLGIGLYGLGVSAKYQLLPVSRLKTTISQIKTLPEGETVGYGRKGQAPSERQIATIPIGYADGLNRRFSNGRLSLRINGQSAPIIGNVCMDMTMLDVTGLQVEEGDEVVVFENAEDLRHMAEVLETIPYEILTGVSRRVKRIYYQE